MSAALSRSRGADGHVRRVAEVARHRGAVEPTNMSAALPRSRATAGPWGRRTCPRRCRGRAPPRGRGADERRTCPPRCRGRASPRGRRGSRATNMSAALPRSRATAGVVPTNTSAALPQQSTASGRCHRERDEPTTVSLKDGAKTDILRLRWPRIWKSNTALAWSVDATSLGINITKRSTTELGSATIQGANTDQSGTALRVAHAIIPNIKTNRIYGVNTEKQLLVARKVASATWRAYGFQRIACIVTHIHRSGLVKGDALFLSRALWRLRTNSAERSTDTFSAIFIPADQPNIAIIIKSIRRSFNNARLAKLRRISRCWDAVSFAKI